MHQMALRGEISQTFHEQSLLFLTQCPQFLSQHILFLSVQQTAHVLELSGYETPTNAHENPYKKQTKMKNIHSDYSVFQVSPVSIKSFIRDLKNVSTCSDCLQSNVRDFSMNLNFYIGFTTAIYLCCISIASVLIDPLKKKKVDK